MTNRTDLSIEQIAHQLVTQVLFHEGLGNSWKDRLTILQAINSAGADYIDYFAHLAMPDHYSKEASDAAKKRIMRSLGRTFIEENKTIQ